MEIKSKEALYEAVCKLVEDFIAGVHEDTDGVKVNVMDDDTVTVEVVADADETDDEDVYPFADFVCYSADAEQGMLTDIDAEYAEEVASAYFA